MGKYRGCLRSIAQFPSHDPPLKNSVQDRRCFGNTVLHRLAGKAPTNHEAYEPVRGLERYLFPILTASSTWSAIRHSQSKEEETEYPAYIWPRKRRWEFEQREKHSISNEMYA